MITRLVAIAGECVFVRDIPGALPHLPVNSFVRLDDDPDNTHADALATWRVCMEVSYHVTSECLNVWLIPAELVPGDEAEEECAKYLLTHGFRKSNMLTKGWKEFLKSEGA